MLSGDEAVQYADNIAAALLREFHPEESERGLMTYYGEDDSRQQGQVLPHYRRSPP